MPDFIPQSASFVKFVLFHIHILHSATIVAGIQDSDLGRHERMCECPVGIHTASAPKALYSQIREHHLDEVPQQLQSVEDNNSATDYIDNAQRFIIEPGTEQ